MIETSTSSANIRKGLHVPESVRKSLHMVAAGTLLLVGNAVGHVLRTSDNPTVKSAVQGAEMLDLYAGASLPGWSELTNSCVQDPTPLDQIIDQGERTIRGE
ncbi:MAG: hypothetical protein PHO20_02305 [Candidatus Peribacteraceae bacterium]|nr:hypothetical protein [Candidatus Peribacteraceae bacterium]MDD5739575.1 hypothetical protein [Candidatus Peribacteraceae bacterium]